jgi:hypothetical protein
MRRLFACLTLFAIGSIGSIGSIAHAAAPDAVPTASRHSVIDVTRLDSVMGSPLDFARLGAEDLARDEEGLPPRFAVPERVSITPARKGTWEDLGNGEMLWRLRILGQEGTNSLNLGFTRYKMPPHGRLLLYSTDGSQVMRPFTAEDNETHGQLWTPVILTADLIVELTVPKREMNEVDLRLGWINQGYRGFGTTSPDSYNKSGSCNLDVECLATGDSWRQVMRAVGVISTGGSTFCTGSLINDTANDQKMYFMTANHCSINSGNAASLVVYWNYQNSFCRTPGSTQSGQAGDGQLTQFHTGSFFRAASAPSDFTLVELDDPPVTAYNHHWAGWDRSTGNFTCTAGSPCASIHHPNTDEKRITYVTTNTATTSYNATASPGDGTHVWAHWATDPPGPYTTPGVTEPGSSGSPLYNAAGRFIGQLHGGPSSCGATGDNLSDYYGRFSVSWTGGGTSSTRLSNWLDAGNTGATTIAGIDMTPCTPPAAPASLTATAAGANQINLSWSAVSGATQYNVYRSTTSGGPYTLAGSSTTTSFSNTGLTCNTTYYYVVRAMAGCESANSNQASALTAACPVCTTQTLYTNGFETGTGLTGWATGTFVSGGSTVDWRGIQTCTAKTGTKIFRFGNTGCTTDYGSNRFAYAQPNGTTGVAVPAGSTTTRLSFWHRRGFESGFDGGTLRVSVNGTTYVQVPATAILSGTTYNGTSSTSCPPTGAGGLPIFTGTATTFTNTTVDLDAVCNLATGGSGGCAGQSVRIGFTTLTDCSVTDDGWFLDDVNVTACVP